MPILLVLCRIIAFVFVFFFFSSRRRHTRSLRDWSSDVCSSDLSTTASAVDTTSVTGCGRPSTDGFSDGHFGEFCAGGGRTDRRIGWRGFGRLYCGGKVREGEIGRASCRERVWMWVVAGSLEKKR